VRFGNHRPFYGGEDVKEFISETEGGEYSINPHYPYGKWYFYERILQVPVYIIFQAQTGELEVYRLVLEFRLTQPATKLHSLV
jgi:hypothetical protein